MTNYDRQEFSSYTVLESRQSRSAGAVSKKFMAGVFTWMFAGLGASTLFALLFANSPELLSYLVRTTNGVRTGLTGLGMLVMFAPLIFVLTMSFAFNKLSVKALMALFLAYAVVNGISFSFILLNYTASSVVGCFAAAAGMFGVMALMGYTTDKDLTSFGSILTMGMIGMVVAIMVNWFLHSAMLDYIISLVGVAVFTGLTAYDVQKLKRIGAGVEFGSATTGKLVLMGALSLYMDFMLIFMYLLRLFGDRRD